MTYTAIEGDVLDAICWRQYGRQAGAVEAVLAANPGLADLGPVLPLGTVIELPVIDEAPASGYVRLWT